MGQAGQKLRAFSGRRASHVVSGYLFRSEIEAQVPGRLIGSASEWHERYPGGDTEDKHYVGRTA